MLIMSTYRIGRFAKLVRRTPATIRRWEAEGKITSKRLPSGHRYFDDSDLRAVMGVKAEQRVTVVYCRVSCKGQKPDLDRQLESMQMWAVGSGTVVDEWITDTWSAPQLQGINHIFWVQPSLRARNPKRAPSFNSVAKPHSENIDRLSETPASRVSARIG